MRRRIGAAIALSAAALVGGTALFAPQIVPLWKEGFPAEVWPAPGEFTQLGQSNDVPVTPTPALPPGALTLFTESGGRALLVEKSGVLMHEHYAPEIASTQKLNSFSLVKSLVGVLILRAVAEGRIETLDVTLRDILGADAPDVTLRATLTMTNGLRAAGEPPKPAEPGKPLDDRKFSPFSPVGRMHAYGIEALLPKLSPDPQMRGNFHYQSANTALLGLVIEKLWDQPLAQVLDTLIWTPSGAGQAHWRRNPTTGRVSAYCCLYARPTDWLRVARFLINNGTPDAPFLPEKLWRDWLNPTLPPQVRRNGYYGLHIRHDVLDRPGAAISGPFAYMMGHGGQAVYFLPDHDLIVVRFGKEPQLLHSTIYTLFP